MDPLRSAFCSGRRGAYTAAMIPTLHLDRPEDRQRVEQILRDLRLDPVTFALNEGVRAQQAAVVQQILADVARRGDDALVEQARKFDDRNFTADQIRVPPEEMKAAVGRVPAEQLAAIRRSITQVREYQSHLVPQDP